MLAPDEQRTLLVLARRALTEQLAGADVPPPAAGTLSDALRAPGACFVTLTRGGALRGCMGSLAPQRPLWRDAMSNAIAAGTRDPRFAPLTRAEADGVRLAISVLGPTEPLAVADRAALLAALRPGRDGLVLEDGARRATFLPKVWEQLATPEAFVAQLSRKAGLPPDHWSDTLRCQRYAALDFSEEVG
jgi:AmmeMemoRadiSam system protein A